MRSPCSIVHAVFLLALLVQPSISYPVHGTDKVSGTVFVKDSLTTPRQEAKIEAKLVSKGLLHVLTPAEELSKKQMQKEKLAKKDKMAELIRIYRDHDSHVTAH